MGDRRSFCHADANGFAMQKLPVTSRRFQCMSEGVAKIEHRAIIVFALVLFDNFRLDSAAGADHPNQEVAVERYQFINILLQESEERRIVDDSILDDFGESSD